MSNRLAYPPGSVSSMLGWIDVFSYLSAAEQTSVLAWTGTDVTAAVTAAIAAIPSTGGVLYFRPGKWSTSGGFTLPYATTILGGGTASYDLTMGVTVVECNAATVLFTFTAKIGLVERIALTDPAGVATSAVVVNNGTGYEPQQVNYEGVFFEGFDTTLDVRVGDTWHWHDCFIKNCRTTGIKIQNTVNGDGGGWSLSDSFIYPASGATHGIYVLSSGGGNIQNVKISPAAGTITNGIYADYTGVLTGELRVTNCTVSSGVTNPFTLIGNSNANRFTNVVIADNYFTTTSLTAPAVSLRYVSQITVTGNRFAGSGAAAITAASCDTVTTGLNVSLGFTTELTTSGSGISGIQVLAQSWIFTDGYIYLLDQTSSGVRLKQQTGGLGTTAELLVVAGDNSANANVLAKAFRTVATSDAQKADASFSKLYLNAFNQFQMILDNGGTNYGMLSNAVADQFWFGTSSDGVSTTVSRGLGWGEGGNALLGAAGTALAINATTGWPQASSSAGTPTGIPATTYTGKVPFQFDTTNVELDAYIGSQWNTLSFSGGINTQPPGNVTVGANYSLIVIGSYTLAAAKTLTLGAGATMRII